jgi:hypothetical protein
MRLFDTMHRLVLPAHQNPAIPHPPFPHPPLTPPSTPTILAPTCGNHSVL